MAGDAHDPWAGSLGDPAEEAARRRVGTLAWVALAASGAGAVLGIPTIDERTGRWYAGLVLLLTGLLLGAACLRHGMRNEHERGRAPAFVAVLVGFGLTAFMLALSYFGLGAFGRIR